ncbi:Glycosyltransferase BC10 [Camellia lanceoleosa]|uniref:Glycosyltransferase BC10 n=1 Tax=Camellia lanceoleosa TaxID=1840588 RepID=A0ACC0GKS3_9ERIC|nr:Glycosyltransferase BC10 [Camellia lanceoleosa]
MEEGESEEVPYKPCHRRSPRRTTCCGSVGSWSRFSSSRVEICLSISSGGASSRSTFFYNRQLTNSIQVGWGEASMIQAERLVLEAALEDPANQIFVFLSDSCVPLYNFSYIYRYLMASPKSFVDSFLDKKEGRYNPKMSPVIPRSKWRKGSQWIFLVRSHAEVVIDEEVIFPIFKKFCKVDNLYSTIVLCVVSICFFS